MLTGPPPKFHETWDILSLRAETSSRLLVTATGVK